jgi:hypothetical protein
MASFTLKWPSRCRTCGTFLPAGSSARWHHALGHSCRDSEACELRAKNNVAEDKRRKLDEPSTDESKDGEVIQFPTR